MTHFFLPYNVKIILLINTFERADIAWTLSSLWLWRKKKIYIYLNSNPNRAVWETMLKAFTKWNWGKRHLLQQSYEIEKISHSARYQKEVRVQDNCQSFSVRYFKSEFSTCLRHNFIIVNGYFKFEGNVYHWFIDYHYKNSKNMYVLKGISNYTEVLLICLFMWWSVFFPLSFIF